MFSRIISLLLLLSCFVLLTACGQNTSPAAGPQPVATPTVALDAYGTPIVFPTTPPQRIISLLPNTSEILGALQLQGRVVAVDYYTTYPADLASLPKVSGSNGKYNIEQIVALKPDLVLSYGGETKEYDQQLENLGLHIVDLPLSNFSQSLQQIVLIGRLTFTENTASALVNQLQQQIHQIETAVDFAPRNRLLAWYLGGLNFQIEHHLFPQISHVHYPEIAPIVRQACEEFGVRYSVRPTFRAAVAAHFRWLRLMGRPAIATLETLEKRTRTI